jgi:hypothetical protein
MAQIDGAEEQKATFFTNHASDKQEGREGRTCTSMNDREITK